MSQRTRLQDLILLGASALLFSCGGQQHSTRSDLPSGASTPRESAASADGESEARREADARMQSGTAPELLPAQLPASADCKAGSVTVNGQPVHVGGIRYQRWVRPALDQATDHYRIYSEAIDCESSLEDNAEAYELLGHIVAEQYDRRLVSITSGGKTDANAPISIHEGEEGRLILCVEEPITLESATKGTYVWEGRFQATAYCETTDITDQIAD